VDTESRTYSWSDFDTNSTETNGYIDGVWNEWMDRYRGGWITRWGGTEICGTPIQQLDGQRDGRLDGHVESPLEGVSILWCHMMLNPDTARSVTTRMVIANKIKELVVSLTRYWTSTNLKSSVSKISYFRGLNNLYLIGINESSLVTHMTSIEYFIPITKIPGLILSKGWHGQKMH